MSNAPHEQSCDYIKYVHYCHDYILFAADNYENPDKLQITWFAGVQSVQNNTSWK